MKPDDIKGGHYRSSTFNDNDLLVFQDVDIYDVDFLKTKDSQSPLERSFVLKRKLSFLS